MPAAGLAVVLRGGEAPLLLAGLADLCDLDDGGVLRRLPVMEDPEVYLRAMISPPGLAGEGSPLPVVRFSLDAVANAFVVLGLLSAVRADRILAAQRRVLEAAGLSLVTGELSVSLSTRGLHEARIAGTDTLQRIPLAVAAGPVRCRLRRHELVFTWLTLTPEGLWLRYHGDARDSDGDSAPEAARAIAGEIAEDITELRIADDSGRTYRVPAGTMQGMMSGRRIGSGGTVWVPVGEFLAVPAPGQVGSGEDRLAIRWAEFSVESGSPVRAEFPSPAEIPVGTAEPPWPTPAECYLAQLPPPSADWLIFHETVSVELDTAAIAASVADALLVVGALPHDSAVLTGLPDRVHADWRLALNERQLALLDSWPASGRLGGVGLAVRLPFQQATVVIENITVCEDLVSVQLYGHPWVGGGYWPMITPCFWVTAVDDTGVEHEGHPGNSRESRSTYEGSGVFWFWPPVSPSARQLRVAVSTLREAAWALIDIPGR
jgi:hypothetical protein